jgi:hypothetical protein
VVGGGLLTGLHLLLDPSLVLGDHVEHAGGADRAESGEGALLGLAGQHPGLGAVGDPGVAQCGDGGLGDLGHDHVALDQGVLGRVLLTLGLVLGHAGGVEHGLQLGGAAAAGCGLLVEPSGRGHVASPS